MDKKYYPALDETLYRHTLPNGLRIMVVPKPGFSKRMAYLVADFGAIHREFSLDGVRYQMPAGIAHYLEHKMFELPQRDVTAEFAAMGAVVNAFTSYDLTAYYFTCTERFADCLRLLLEFVTTAWFPAESVERELGIIDQEIGMNADEPGTRVYENLVQAMYREHPIRQPILGTEASIRQITPQMLHLCHRAFYHPANLLLCVEGDVDPEQVMQIAARVLPPADALPGIRHCDWQEEMSCPQTQIRDQMEIAMPTFYLGFKCEDLGKGVAAIRQEIVGDLAAEALFGESSELYLRLYEEGVIDSSFGGGYETVDGCAMLSCGGDSDQPEVARDAILAQARHLERTGIEPQDFIRMKRSAMGRRIRDLDSFDSTCFRLCAYELSDYDYFRFPELYESIDRQEILDFLSRVVRPERCSLSIVNTLKEETI